jgi:transposase-like protein
MGLKPLEEFGCINPKCPDYGKKGLGNIRVHQTYGKWEEIRLLQCKTCGKRFSERANTPLYDCRLPKEKALSVFHHLAEGCGQRKTARLVGQRKIPLL